ncbi:hypothetical protein [Terriglobus sp. TAA 43]|uniref:hypothetical protein n=1 Tax=Terriglobus sp. TAA 43 TaxID=278961 RepID=UPI000646776B|nr:hypothetical protein [Terriglobus sp. TAA 43]
MKRAQRGIIAIAIFLMVVTSCRGQTRWPSSVDDNCFVKVTGPTTSFDREHDRDTVNGGSLFCRLGITASKANQAISAFKLAVKSPGENPNAILKFPVEVILPGSAIHGKQVDSKFFVRDSTQWAEFVQNKLNEKQRAAIHAAKLSDMSIVNSRSAGPGFILGNGLVFFSTRDAKRIVVLHLNTEDGAE